MTDRSDVKLAAIFRRGGQKEELLGDGPSSDKQELNQQLQQLAVAWATPKARRGLAAAVWRPLLGAFEVTVRGRQQFNGQGFMHNKKLYLNIEEAVFMMDQAELMLLVEQQEGQQQRLLSMQEALHMMVSLGVSLDRLQLLSHLNRIGYHVRRHPACWLAPAEQPPAATWQCSPAWSTTDGLPPPASAAATATAWHAGSVGVVEQGLAADARHQQQLLQQPEQQKTKRRKVAATELGAAEEAAAEVVQQQLPLMPGWWDKVPAWLAGAQQALAGSGASAADASSMQQQAACGLGQCHDELLGVQLRQQYPELLPLPTYPGQQQQQQQQQHEEAHKQQQGQLQQELHAGPHSSTGGDAEMVFDAIACQAGFSYRCPPAPQISFAMPRQGAACLPCLDELLQLSAAAAAASEPACNSSTRNSTHPPEQAVVGQQKQQQQQQQQALSDLLVMNDRAAAAAAAAGCCKPVMVAMPDGGDINFYELRPVRLMDLLANQY